MFILPSALDGIGGNGAKAYQCIVCDGLITHSDRRLPIGGTHRHLYANPSGVECDFYTFYSCPGAIAFGEATRAHTWFSGYGWRMAFCRDCGQHLGWHYEAVSRSERPYNFWGILVSLLISSKSGAQRVNV
ncbi:MAG: cereblon family protein [Desulfatiglandales bacterium]